MRYSLSTLLAAGGENFLFEASHPVKNVLFIMCDQLRSDYLSCYGHPTLQTPHIDWLASRGVRFDRAYVQGPLCGPSRMSYYSGRYVQSHGVIFNFVPLALNRQMLGDLLRPHGIRASLIGKSHVEPDRAMMELLAIDPTSAAGIRAIEGGFEPVAHEEGVYPWPRVEDDGSPYVGFLRSRGYAGDNPWHDFANAAAAADGTTLTGWQMHNARLPARIPEADSETPYLTDRAIAFIAERGESPWCLHLSYIKPHWPYMAPAPYNDLYGPEDVVAVKQDPRELENAHPVVALYRSGFEASRNFARKDVRDVVIPTYMGLVKQIDDHLGRLLAALRESGRLADTLIIFCSDHGDYLGDHYLGDKELFHDSSSRVPLIVVDPRASADATRGTAETRLVEAIDVVPTILDALGIAPPEHLLEGRSLLPLIEQAPVAWRDAAFSEADYAFRDFVRLPLQRPVGGCHNFMVRTDRWKYNCYDGLRPELFDMQSDPDEFCDLAGDKGYASVLAEMRARLCDWLRHRHVNTTMTHEAIAGWNVKEAALGIRIGEW
jgi:arylsulfatase A-like enzyme